AINPYLAFETIEDLIRQGHISPLAPAGRVLEGEGDAEHKAIYNYVKSVNKDVLKVMSKMGISTAQSYCGAQIFEAIGLGQNVIDEYFTGTSSRVGGIGLDVIAAEVRARHDKPFAERPTNGHTLDIGGHYQYRREGEYHLFNPETVHKLQYACRTGNYKVFKEYSELVNNQSKRLCTLRGLMTFNTNEPEASATGGGAPATGAGLAPRPPVPIEEVEPVEAIMKRFKSGA